MSCKIFLFLIGKKEKLYLLLVKVRDIQESNLSTSEKAYQIKSLLWTNQNVRNKIITGVISVLVGFIVLIFTMDNLGKPDNVPISFHPIDGIEAYFFGFVYGLGTLGWVLASLFLLGYASLCYFAGIWISKMIFKG